MKKLNFLLISVFVCVFLFASCGQELDKEKSDSVTSFESLKDNDNDQCEDEENGKNPPIVNPTLRIRQDAFDTYIKPYPETFIPQKTVNDIWISHYFGKYNGSVVVMLEGWLGYDRGSLEYTVADVSFRWNVHQWPHVWKDGKFHHGLQDAYDAGWLNKNDLEVISVLHNIWW